MGAAQSHESELLAAAKDGSLGVVQRLLDSEDPVKVNCCDRFGRTPLLLACMPSLSRNGYPEIVALLLKKGADVNKREGDGWTPLIQASGSRGADSEVVVTLLRARANVNVAEADGQTALMRAASYGRADLVELLLLHGAQVNLANQDGETALTLACCEGSHGHYEVVQLLLQEEGVDVNKVNYKARSVTALMKAAFNGYADVVELLLAKAADPAIADEDGKTALAWSQEMSRGMSQEMSLRTGHTLVERLLSNALQTVG